MDHTVYDMVIRIEETPRRSGFEVFRQGQRIAAGFMNADTPDGLPDMTLTEGDLWKSMRCLVDKLWQDMQAERFGWVIPTLEIVPVDPERLGE